MRYDCCKINAVDIVDEGLLVIEELLRRFRDYKMPDVDGALWFDPEWVEPFISACNRANLAVGGMCWIYGKQQQPGRVGNARIWAQLKAPNWTKYQLYCNAEARNQLQTLETKDDISFVNFVFINRPSWQYARKYSRQLLQGKRDDLPATYIDGVISFQTPLPLDSWGYAQIPCERGQYMRVPASRRGVFWSVVVSVFVIVVMIIKAIELLAHLFGGSE